MDLAAQKENFKIKSVLSPIIFFFLFSSFGYVLNFLINVVVAHLLSPKEFGDFGLTLQIIFLLVPLITLGSDQYLLEMMPKLADKDNHGFMVWVFNIVVVLSFIFFLVILLFESLHSILMGVKWYDNIFQFIEHVTFSFFWLVPIAAIFMVQISELQVKSKFLAASLSRPLMFLIYLASCTLYLIIDVKVDAEKLLTNFSLLLILFVIIQRVILVRSRKKEPIFEKSMHVKGKVIYSWFKETLIMMMNSLVMYALVSVDLIMYELLGQAEHNLGYLLAMLTSLALIFVVSGSINIGVAPLINKYKSVKTKQKLLRLGLLFQVVALTVTGILFVVFGRHILTLFGKQYVTVYPYFVLLTCAMVFSQYFKIFEVFMRFGINKKRLFYFRAVQLGAIVVGSAILIPFFDIAGSVIALVISQIIIVLLMLYFVVIPYLQGKVETLW